MASIAASAFHLVPNRTTTSSSKQSQFPPKRSRFLKPLAAASGEGSPEGDSGGDPVKVAFAKAAAYNKSKASEPSPAPDARSGGDCRGSEAPDPVKLAMDKAREYKKNRGVLNPSASELKNSGEEKMNTSKPRVGYEEKKLSKKEELKISGTDFLGLGFSEKKWYKGNPPGLVPVVETIPEGEFPEVEIIVGDTSKFEVTAPSQMCSDKDSDTSDIYKPKVSTWGVFPRPSNISKTFGGGRVIQPGEVLETAEDKVAKEKRTRELIAAYRKKRGLTIDPITKAACEKALEEGDKLMDLGKLKEALPYYEKIMKDLVFQSKLHGQAAFQWSICQDSLRRTKEARAMYEKLQSHPDVEVSKKARQFVFSFQAMEMMKVTNSSYTGYTGYEKYFDAFVENKVDYSQKGGDENEGALRQGLPYIMFLASPVFIVFLIVLRKSFQF